MKRPRELEDDSEPSFEDADPAPCLPQGREPHVAKLPYLDTVDEDAAKNAITVRCFLPPHHASLTFSSYQEYESHYNLHHMNRCLACHKVFPSEHLLGVHIEEVHDPLIRIQRDKGEHTYSCFVEDCGRKCLTRQKRRRHMIDKHMYPENYFFAVTQEGIEGRRSLLVDGQNRRSRPSTASTSQGRKVRAGSETGRRPDELQDDGLGETMPSELKEGDSVMRQSLDADVAELTGALSALKFVPPSVRFGRGRAGFPRNMKDHHRGKAV